MQSTSTHYKRFHNIINIGQKKRGQKSGLACKLAKLYHIHHFISNGVQYLEQSCSTRPEEESLSLRNQTNPSQRASFNHLLLPIQVKPHMFLMRVCIRRYMLISQRVQGTIWCRPVTVFALKSEKFLSSAPLLPGHGGLDTAGANIWRTCSRQGGTPLQAVVVQQ